MMLYLAKVGVTLLIVPYGIETALCENQTSSSQLLIVPYGIETTKKLPAYFRSLSFNRTLWN